MSTSRQLAAILFADIAGYTSLMETDEALSLQLREKLKISVTKETGLHEGRIIKWMGDGVICSFGSASEATRAAIAIQLSMQQEPNVPVRIGIHQADVIFEAGDVHGDGVNIASRLESLAVPGSIFISAKVYDDIKNQKDIQTVSLGKYVLKNIKEPIEIFAVSNPGVQVPLNKKLVGKGVKFVDRKFSIAKKTLVLRIIIVLLLLAIGGYLIFNPIIKKQYARTQLLPAIIKLVNDNFRPPTEAYDLAIKAEKYIPNDSALTRLFPNIFSEVSIVTNPEGAEVFWKDYHTPDAPWRFAGITPIKDARFSRSFLRIEIRKDGYETMKYAGPMGYARLGQEIDTLKLDKKGSLPDNMVRIPAKISTMMLVGLEHAGDNEIGEFLMDRFEVSNKHYKKFMDEGGYENKTFWKYPVNSNGKQIPLDDALKLFLDKTGRPGPATWEAGTYPDGQENHPVTGVSWYEAAAYAAYVHKQLPTVYHWARVADLSRTEFIVPLSNYNSKSSTAVGSMPGYNSFGVYDLAGNAREWCYNETKEGGFRFILGGGWNDPTYAFNDSYTQPSLDRSPANGFRCIQIPPRDTSMVRLTNPISMAFRDYSKEKPVDDKTFDIFLRQFDYDKGPLKATIDSTIEREDWTAQRISFEAGYNKERMQIYLYLPKNGKKPYQPILFFPGSGDLHSKKFKPESIAERTEFIVKSGRALVYPIYKSTHERHDDLKADVPDATVFYKDHVIMWRKDLSRTIDYLESRTDIRSDNIGFLGWSWGGYLGGIYPAIEKRIKAVVLNVGGMLMQKTLPEVDQINFLPRIVQPVLMLNGKHDMFFPVETSQKPMFNFLGTPAKDKKIITYDVGHLVPRTEFVKEALLWYDKYLGPVK